MEEEQFLTGYCRALDQSRMVAVVLTGGVIDEVDCGFGGCPYEPNCQIAAKLRELTKA